MTSYRGVDVELASSGKGHEENAHLPLLLEICNALRECRVWYSVQEMDDCVKGEEPAPEESRASNALETKFTADERNVLPKSNSTRQQENRRYYCKRTCEVRGETNDGHHGIIVI